MKITGIVAALLWDMKFYFGTGQELTKRTTKGTVYGLSLANRVRGLVHTGVEIKLIHISCAKYSTASLT